VAVWPSPAAVNEVGAAVAGVQNLANALVPGLRWTTPERWHLTLAFLGEVDDVRRADLEARLARSAGRHASMTLRFAGSGRFGDRVLFAKVAGDVAHVRRLADSVVAAARRARIDVDERPFRPHLTLARSAGGHGAAGGHGRGGGAASPDLAPVLAALSGFEGTPWTAGELCLVRSRLGQGPGRRAEYENVAVWTLQGPRRNDRVGIA